MRPEFDIRELAAEFAADALSSGEFADRGTTLKEFVREFDGHAWRDRERDVDDVLSDPDFREGFASWMVDRVKFAVGRLDEELERARRGDELLVARAMMVPSGWRERVGPGEPLGKHWALDHGMTDIEPHEFDDDLEDEVLIEAVVSPDAVNWKEALRARCDFFFGDREAEVVLGDDARVQVERRLPRAADIPEGAYGAANPAAAPVP